MIDTSLRRHVDVLKGLRLGLGVFDTRHEIPDDTLTFFDSKDREEFIAKIGNTIDSLLPRYPDGSPTSNHLVATQCALALDGGDLGINLTERREQLEKALGTTTRTLIRWEVAGIEHLILAYRVGTRTPDAHCCCSKINAKLDLILAHLGLTPSD